MFKNYIVVSLRALYKRKTYTLLNLSGLFAGITICLLIFQYASYQYSYDTFENNYRQIVRLRLDEYAQGKLAWQSATVYPIFGPGLKRALPEVEAFCRVAPSRLTLSNDERNARFKEENGYYVDTSFLRMFSVKLIAGNASGALDGPGKILLSQTNAARYFGNTNPVGKYLVYRHAKYMLTFKVTGVFKKFPDHSHIAVSHIASYPTLYTVAHIYGDTTNMMETSITLSDFYTYLQLKPNTDVKKMEEKFPAFCNNYINSKPWAKTNQTVDEIHTIPLTQIHLNSHCLAEARVNGDAKSVAFIFLAGIFIAVIAWVNYINFATARSVERAREVGMRKVMGAKKTYIALQFMLESLILNFMALLIALPVAWLFAPTFNTLMGEEAVSFSMEPAYWAGFILMFIMGSFLSGFYPALILSSYKTLTVLKGAFKNNRNSILLRKGLMVFQFAVAFFLISTTIVVYAQLSFMLNGNLGEDISETLVLTGAQSVPVAEYKNAFQPFKHELMQKSGIMSVAASYFVPGQENNWTSSVKDLSSSLPEVTVYTCPIDYEYIPQYQIKIFAGRNFSDKTGTDANTVILNEKALPLLGFKSPQAALNHKIIRNSTDTLTIIGVVANVHTEGLQKNISPQIMLLAPNTRWYYSIKLGTAGISNKIDVIEKTWARYFPNDPFSYFFLDEYFGRQYKAEQQFAKMFNLFAGIAIIIACLGLLSLSSYNILQRKKEISIRKILGASYASIFYLLSKNYLFIISIAFLISIPITWWVLNNWLQNFAYQIKLSVVYLVAAGILLALIALFTISFQILRALHEKPSNNLRAE